eukprot:scaffold10494_cov53-Phaeocystis_antarctica.AAC.5
MANKARDNMKKRRSMWNRATLLVPQLRASTALRSPEERLQSPRPQRDRADKLDKVKRNDPAYERLQDEKKRREEKKKGWKIFDPD